MLFQQNKTARGQAGSFHRAGEHTDRVRAIGSGRCQNSSACSLLQKNVGHFRPGFIENSLRVCLRAHKRVVVQCSRSDDASLHQLPESVAGKRDVQVPVDGRTIKANTIVALQDVPVRSLGRESRGRISWTEGTVATAVQPGCSH